MERAASSPCTVERRRDGCDGCRPYDIENIDLFSSLRIGVSCGLHLELMKNAEAAIRLALR
jgi:hypothetical protein